MAVISATGDRQQRAELDQVRLFLTRWRGSLVAITLDTVGVAIAWGDMVPLRVRAAGVRAGLRES